MIEEKEIKLKKSGGGDLTFYISKLPAFVGFEIMGAMVTKKVDDKEVMFVESQEKILKLFSYISVKLSDGGKLTLTTSELIDNHCHSWEVVLALQTAMLSYNLGFLKVGGKSKG